MLECPNCRRKFQQGSRFCGFCGTALTGTRPAVGSPNGGHREPLARSQNSAGFQVTGNPEDTIVFKKPDGFTWQSPSQHTPFSENDLPQPGGHASSSEEEATTPLARPANAPATPARSVPPTPSATPTTPDIHSFHVPASNSAASGLTGIATTPNVAARPAKTAGDHAAFTIPTRPGRVGNPAIPGQAAEVAGEIAPPGMHARIQVPETPGNQTLLGMHNDSERASVDCAALASAVQEVAARPCGSAVSRSLPSLPCPSDEAASSPDLPADVAVAVSLPLASSEIGTPVLADEIPAESFQSDPSVDAVSALPVTSAEPGAEYKTDLSDLLTPPEEEEASESQEADEVDISAIPTVPAASYPVEVPEEIKSNPAAFFAPFRKPSEVSAHLLKGGDPYLHLKLELAEQRIAITAAMDELLPLVYDNHREENQALFALILATRPPLDDEAWGHAAFVLGAYGNYMYRNPLSFMKKLEIWRAQLWAVYYERSYRRKYLAQRCQQLIHYFQGSADNPTFLAIALHDLETLYLYLEPGSLRKLQQMLSGLLVPPEDLLQGIEVQMVIAEQEKAERMARQSAPAQAKKSAPINKATGVRLHKPRPRVAQPGEREEHGSVVPSAARNYLGFLNEEQLQYLFASLRADHLEKVQQLLSQERQQILSALRAELLKTSTLEYQRPRKAVPLRQSSRGGSDHDRFSEVFRLLSSPKPKDQQMALRVFEQNMRENIKQEYEQGVREWMLYARAIVLGSTRVAVDWERDSRSGEASWEEIWNLAYYHHVTNNLAETMRVLAPGLNELDAPVLHLRLALICALTLLLEPDQVQPATLQDARNLLIGHLERWPHPLSCLAWLALSNETPGALRPLALPRYLGIFQELLEYPVDLPNPRVDLTETQINALEEALTGKTHCEEAWFLWLNDYAARRPHNFLAWQRLAATSERMNHLARAETALQHIAGIYYDLDYVYAQEGEEGMQAAEELRLHVEKLFDFYCRHEMHRQAWESFESCYSTLNHLGFWDEQTPANRHLLALVRPFLTEFQRQEAQRREAQRLADAQDAKSRSEIRRGKLSGNPTRPLESFPSGRRVGIFVDYENIARFIPHEGDMEHVGQMLVSYAEQFGEVVCCWASASPRNLSNLTAVRTGLEAAQFKIRYPRRELQFSASQKDLADYALLECINNASLNDHLDVYLVVSGDRDYYERIYSLLESGRTVRILARSSNLSASYRDLLVQRLRKQQVAGHEESDFFIDDLDDVLPSLPTTSR